MRKLGWWKVCKVLLPALVLMLGLLLVGCGGGEEEVTQPAPAAAPAAEQTSAAPEAAAPKAVDAPVEPVAVKEAPTAPATPVTDGPLTLDVLQWTPAQAQVAFAMPPVNGTIAKLLTLDERIEAVDLAGELDKIVADLAEDADVEEAKTLNDIAVAKGVNLDAPLALFLDFAPAMQSALDAAEAVKTAEAKKEATEETAEEGAAEATAEKTEEAEAVSEMPEIDMDDVDAPAFAVVFGVTDAAKAEAALKEIIATNEDLNSKAADSVTVGEITIQVYDTYGYFLANDKLTLGSLELVKGVAERVAAPVQFRYGTPECPATAKDEAVMLAFGERAMPLLKQVLPLLEMDEGASAFMQAKVASLETMFDSADEEDPLVLTLSWKDNVIELKSRLDTAKHPKVLESTGEALPLELAQLLPESTLAFLSLRLTDEYKKQLTDVYMEAVPADMKANPGFAQGMTMAKQVLTMLGKEITLGLSATEQGLPGISLLVDLANPEPTKGLLQMLVPTMPGETYNEVEISSIAAPIPVALSLAFVGNSVMIGTNVDMMKGMIDKIKAGEKSKLFASLTPPLDPAVPRYSAFLLNTKLFSDVLVPLATMFGGLPEDAQPVIEQVTGVLDQVRTVSEMDGDWQTAKVSLYLK